MILSPYSKTSVQIPVLRSLGCSVFTKQPVKVGAQLNEVNRGGKMPVE